MVKMGVEIATITLLSMSSVIMSWRWQMSAFRSKVTRMFQLPPRTGGGQGEWADWDTDNYLEDEYVDEDEVTPSAVDPALLALAQKGADANDEASNFNQLPSSQSKMKAPADWDRPDAYSGRLSKSNEFGDASLMREPWSEEAPYFDEADVQDDQGNWGRDASMQFSGAVKGSSLWMSRSEYAAVAEERALTPAATGVYATESKHASSSGIPATVTAAAGVATTRPTSTNTDSRAEHPHAFESRLAKLERSISDLTVSLAWVKGFGAGIAFMLIAFKILE